MNVYETVDVFIHTFLTSAVARGEWSDSRPGRFAPRETPSSTHCIGGWADPRAGQGDVKERKFLTLPGLEFRPHGRPATRYTD
jgi:hypothetical protein